MKWCFLISGYFLAVGTSLAQQLTGTSPASKAVSKLPLTISTAEDSLTIFELIDSLVNLPTTESGSTLVVRAGYTSNVLSVNSGFAINQYALSPGVSYYHKTGFYLDLTAYWSQEYNPSLFLTIPSVGYLKSVKKWTINAEYSRLMYSLDDSQYPAPFKNALGMTNYLDVKPFLFRLDYYVYFGDKTGHRITPAISLNLRKKNWHHINQLYFYPTFAVQFGNDSWQDYQLYSDPVYRYRHNLPLYYLADYSAFGVLNYMVSAPIGISVKNWAFQTNYTYNFVQALPGETLNSSNYGFVSFSVIRYINFKTQNPLFDFYKLPK